MASRSSKHSGNPQGDIDDATCVTMIGTPGLRLGLPRAKQVRPYLIVLVGSNVGEMYRIDGNEAVLGRSPTAQVRFNDEGVSRRHARVLEMGGSIVVEDLKSANGTLVNGEVVERRALKDGDKVQLGPNIVLRFTYHDELDESFQRQMYDAALRDGLTKAFNKKYFLSRLETELAYSRRHKTALSLIMMDVDHFKRVNDNFGHPAGDAVLVGLAGIVLRTIRTEDVFARYGGEEFAVICRGVPRDNACVLAERLRSICELTSFEHEGKRMPVTISLGVAGFPEFGAETSLQLVAAADEALYTSKNGGRNRWTKY
jgi:two-component system cell cycle response regulator